MDRSMLKGPGVRAKAAAALALALIFAGLVMYTCSSDNHPAEDTSPVMLQVPDADNPEEPQEKLDSYAVSSAQASADRHWQELEQLMDQAPDERLMGKDLMPSLPSETVSRSRTRTQDYVVEDLFGACPEEDPVPDVKPGGPASPQEGASVAKGSPAPPASLRVESFADGFSSFGDGTTGEAEVAEPSRTYRCMFLRDERIRSGQRVTVRLLEDMEVDGVVIPRNTHLQGVCSISDRVGVTFRSLDVGGRILSFSYDAYDMDGGRGIYCPDLSQTRKQVVQEGLGAVSSGLGAGLRTAARQAADITLSIIRSKAGEVTVSIPSGYNFYIMRTDNH